jgi:Spy/CpxP family protein refolding chaperone
MTKTVFRTLLLSLLVLTTVITISFAQITDDIDPRLSKEKMAQVRERVDSLRMWKLTKALDLDEKMSAKLFPILSRFDRKRSELQFALVLDLRELKAALAEKGNVKIKEALDKLETHYDGLQQLNHQERSELKQILTPEQQAKYVIFQIDFAKEVRKMIAEAREKRLRNRD